MIELKDNLIEISSIFDVNGDAISERWNTRHCPDDGVNLIAVSVEPFRVGLLTIGSILQRV